MLNEDEVYEYIVSINEYIEGEEWVGYVSEDNFEEALNMFEDLRANHRAMRLTKNKVEEEFYIYGEGGLREIYRLINPPRSRRKLF
jgi:hypothetical protein